MYEIIFTNQFKKDYKLCEKRGLKIELLDNLLIELATTGTLPKKNKAHLLSGNLSNHWECHIKADWLLIWLQDDVKKSITLVATGTHSDLFR
jgi:mRNA interferase YafQ